MGTHNNSTIIAKIFALIIFVILSFTGSVYSQSINETIPKQDKRLLVIGDSLTSGLYASSENKTYARLVADEMNVQLARKFASTLDDAIIEWEKVKVWHPDIIVLEVGLNDVSKGKYNSEWVDKYYSLVNSMQNTNATIIVNTTFWGGISENHPNYKTYLSLNESIRTVAIKTKVLLSDLWEETKDCDGCVSVANDESYWGPHYHGDNFHPNDKGHMLISRSIINAFNGCVCDSNVEEPKVYKYYFTNLTNN